MLTPLYSSSLIVRISAEVARPRDDRQSDGTFLIAMELTSMGSPAWENLRYAPDQKFSST